jgi:soluble lytic murein transglycosylase
MNFSTIRMIDARNPRNRLLQLAWIAAGFTLFLLAGCGSGETAEPPERLAGVEATAPLLPTPTLAAPNGTADPLRPPTPVVLASPTPLPGETAASPTETAVDPATSAPTEVLPSPTPVLPEGATPLELLELGRRAAAEGDQSTAAAAFQAVIDDPGDLSDSQIVAARLGLAVALLVEDRPAEAAVELEIVAQAPQDRAGRDSADSLLAPLNTAEVAAFHLGQARAAQGDHAGAIEAFAAYLQHNPDMAAYVQPLIADAHEALGDTEGVIAALESSLDAPAQRFVVVANRGRLADLYLQREDYAAAIAQYDAIRDIAQTAATKAQMTYLAGLAEIAAGNTAAGHERFLYAIDNYPQAADSYYALVDLINAGAPVDDYQRGVVDYYAAAYTPAVEALRRHIATQPETYNQDSHLFLAWSYEGLGDLDSALAELAAFAEGEPARALFERAEILRRAGRNDEALAAYDQLSADYPEAENVAGVLWSAAVLADEAGAADAADRYLLLADTFPFDANTPNALARAAELVAADDPAAAIALWQRLAEQYPANIYGAEALFRLLRVAEGGAVEGPDADALIEQIETLTPTNYFALRAADYAADIPPFTADGPMVLPADDTADRAEAETWLRDRLAADGVVPPANLGALSPELAAEPQRIIGEKLWQLGLLEEAKAELETLREKYTGDALANYQMALYFRELGLYRSSIVAASALLRQASATVFDAPRFLGRLSYPVYFADLILPLAEKYGYDPRLQFALVRQESLFESFAWSGAAAQGLSQVIPDTGAWIAQRLAWPDFENEDLYKPYVGLNFGAYYLSQQLGTFGGNVPAALAAYNAGPGNAARWFDAAGSDHDLFVDAVDFSETRLYIERIYEGFNAYRYLYSRP